MDKTSLCRLLKRVFLSISFCILIFYSGTLHAQPQPIYITGGYYFDVENQQMVENEGILIRGGRFYKVGGAPAQNERGDYMVIKLAADEYVLPGIVDVHAHYRMDAFGSESLQEIDEFKYNALVYLANGVTSTFSNGVYYPELERAAKKLINTGQWSGPRFFASGPYFGTARPGWEDYSAEEIYAQVDEWAAKGVDGFKTKGGDPETIKHLVKRAHFHGLTVAGHLGSGYRGTTNSIDAIDMGIDRVEHILGGFVLDSTQSAYPVWNKVDTTSTDFKNTMQYFIDHGVYFDATINAPVYFTTLKEGFDYWADERTMFTPYVRKTVGERTVEGSFSELAGELYWAMRRSTKAFFDAGGGELITLGTDAPSHGFFLAGFGAHREMHTMVMAGIPEAAVLKIATQNSANSIGQGSLMGSIKTGKLADIYIVKGNPLENITNTRNVQTVIKSGEIYDPAELLNRVKGNIGPADSTETENWFRYEEFLK